MTHPKPDEQVQSLRDGHKGQAEPAASRERPILFSAPMVRAILDGRKTQTRRIVKPMAGRQREWLTEERLAMVPRGVVGSWGCGFGWQMDHPAGGPGGWIRCPYGVPGDLLWVRESGALLREAYDHNPQVGEDLWRDAGWRYADGSVAQCRDYDPPLNEWVEECAARQRPSIHMPRWASRITLRIADVRVERLNEISEADAIAEGVRRIGEGYPSFANPDSDWHAGPNLWTVEDGGPFGGSLNSPTAPGAFQMLWESINGPGSWDENPWVWVVAFERIANPQDGGTG